MTTKAKDTIYEPVRQLRVDFDLYADNDLQFKKEMIRLMISNLEELQEARQISQKHNRREFFRKACHKVNTTLAMLADPEFDAIIVALKDHGMTPDRTAAFDKINAEIMESLRAEKNGTSAS